MSQRIVYYFCSVTFNVKQFGRKNDYCGFLKIVVLYPKYLLNVKENPVRELRSLTG